MAITEDKVLYTARMHTTGGRAGQARSSDGRLDVQLSVPGSSKPGTNPEQLFAAGWSACFESAIAGLARAMKVKLPDDLSIDTEVDLNVDNGEYSLAARMNISIPGIDRAIAQQLIDQAEKTCPYSKAVRGNIPASFKLV